MRKEKERKEKIQEMRKEGKKRDHEGGGRNGRWREVAGNKQQREKVEK